MSSSKPDSSTTDRGTHPLELQVVNWPLRDKPLHVGLVLVGCILIGYVSGAISRSWSMGIISGLVLVLALWKLWIPITCQLGPRGVTVSVFRWRRHVSWREIDRLESRGHGVTFVTDSDRSALVASVRGLYLPWPGDRRAVREVCEHYHSRFTLHASTVSRKDREQEPPSEDRAQ